MRIKSVTVTNLLKELTTSRKSRTPTWKAVVAYLLEKQGSACAICGRAFVEVGEISVDHVVPRKAGGVDRLKNFQLAHRVCNVRRGYGPPNKSQFQCTRLQTAGIIPMDVRPGSAEYRSLYQTAKDDVTTEWWQRHGKQLVGAGRRFSYREWDYIQDDVYGRVWWLRMHQGEEAVMNYEPMRKEFANKRK